MLYTVYNIIIISYVLYHLVGYRKFLWGYHANKTDHLITQESGLGLSLWTFLHNSETLSLSQSLSLLLHPAPIQLDVSIPGCFLSNSLLGVLISLWWEAPLPIPGKLYIKQRKWIRCHKKDTKKSCPSVFPQGYWTRSCCFLRFHLEGSPNRMRRQVSALSWKLCVQMPLAPSRFALGQWLNNQKKAQPLGLTDTLGHLWHPRQEPSLHLKKNPSPRGSPEWGREDSGDPVNRPALLYFEDVVPIPMPQLPHI